MSPHFEYITAFLQPLLNTTVIRRDQREQDCSRLPVSWGCLKAANRCHVLEIPSRQRRFNRVAHHSRKFGLKNGELSVRYSCLHVYHLQRVDRLSSLSNSGDTAFPAGSEFHLLSSSLNQPNLTNSEIHGMRRN